MTAIPSATNADNEYKAYAIFDGKGVAYDDVAANRTVTAGAKRYTSTGQKYTADKDVQVNNVTIFYYKN